MRKLFDTLVNCIDDLMYYMLLLALFLFITALAGVTIFRDKQTIKGVHSRNNFDTFGWALITCFQIMTPENFNQVITDGINAVGWGGGVYLLFVMIFGHYVIETLFMVIIVSNFHVTDENEKSIADLEATTHLSFTDKLMVCTVLEFAENCRKCSIFIAELFSFFTCHPFSPPFFTLSFCCLSLFSSICRVHLLMCRYLSSACKVNECGQRRNLELSITTLMMKTSSSKKRKNRLTKRTKNQRNTLIIQFP